MSPDTPVLDPELVICTRRLELHAPAEQDLPAVWSAVHSPALCKALGWRRPSSISSLRNIHARNLALWREGRQYVFSARCARSNAFVGRVALSRSEATRGWQLAYWVAPEQAGHGYGTEMARSAIGLGLNTLLARRVSALCAVSNRASARVLEKAGMQCMGAIPTGLELNGCRVPARSYAAIRER